MGKVKRSRRKKKKWMDSLKQGLPCSDCRGNFPPYVMDWDHVRGEKEFSLGDTLSNNISRERILVEIEKCDLVCANCHRIRTNEAA